MNQNFCLTLCQKLYFNIGAKGWKFEISYPFELATGSLYILSSAVRISSSSESGSSGIELLFWFLETKINPKSLLILKKSSLVSFTNDVTGLGGAGRGVNNCQNWVTSFTTLDKDQSSNWILHLTCRTKKVESIAILLDDLDWQSTLWCHSR